MARSRRSRLHTMAARQFGPANVSQPPFNMQMALLGVQMVHANLAAVRSVFDAWRTMVRAQQDVVLDALDTQVHEAVSTEGAEPAAEASANSDLYPAPHDVHAGSRNRRLDAFG